MVKKNNKVLYISIVSISVIVIGIVIWGFLTDWKFWNYKQEKEPDTPKLPEYKLNVPIQKNTTKIEMDDPEKKGFQIGQEIQFGTGNKSETRTIVGIEEQNSLILDAPIKYDHPKGTVIKVIKPTPTGKFSTKYCQKYNKNGSCQKCFSNLPLKNGSCIQSDNCKSENKCKTCNKFGNKCERCEDGYVPVSDGKCCEHPIYDNQQKKAVCQKKCGDKYCLETENCLTIPETTNKKCCPFSYVQKNGRCCNEGEILDKYNHCCPPNKIVNNECCNSPGEIVDEGGIKSCKIKCTQTNCNLNQKCSSDGTTCESKNCDIDTVDKTYTTYEQGKNAKKGINTCKIDPKVNANIEKGQNKCQYPVYTDGSNKFIYLNKKYAGQIDKSKYTTKYDQNTSGCVASDCSGTSFENNVCHKTEEVPVIENDKSICPFSNDDICCKTKDGDYTGQICTDSSSKCIITNNTHKCVTPSNKCTTLENGQTCQNGTIQGDLYNGDCNCDCHKNYYGSLCQYPAKTYKKFQNWWYSYDGGNRSRITDIESDYDGFYKITLDDLNFDLHYSKEAIQEICKNPYQYFETPDVGDLPKICNEK